MLWHTTLELLAYAIGARIYWSAAAGQPRPAELADRLALLAGAICGAFVGSKLLHVAEHLPALVETNQVELWLAGKSLVGGLLGGTLGVELVKRRIGWTRPTGDAGCRRSPRASSSGASAASSRDSGTSRSEVPRRYPGHGTTATASAGIPRQPTRSCSWRRSARACMRWSAPPGARFAAFLLGYCAIRFVLEFLKPPFGGEAGTLPVALYAGLTAIQWAAAVGAAYFTASLRRRLAPAQLASA
jgi:prolipoprotein diacylglyceryltransferase